MEVPITINVILVFSSKDLSIRFWNAIKEPNVFCLKPRWLSKYRVYK